MTSLKRILASSGLTGLLGALAFAGPASANLKAVCVVDGDVKAHTTKPSIKKYVQLAGGHGTYELMDVNALCIDIAKGKAPGTTQFGRVRATGTFKQEIILKDDPAGQSIEVPCGSGKVTGVIASQALGAKFNVLVAKKFAIQFAMGHGEFFWHHQGPSAKNTGPPKLIRSSREAVGEKPGPKPYRFAGSVQLSLPGATGKDPAEDLAKRQGVGTEDKCTKAFHVTGVVMVHEQN
ncbi:MAG: hypothetical protein M3141_00630 [Actinomycetota bacterium]|nr:hypothetical protein [Actinomycetota bacterium]